jgi:thiol-disulfide isomerase/thioredoxin
MKIYTKTGDDGTTGLIGGVRVKKSDAQIEAYGTVDELNSHLGLLRDTFLNSETQGQLTIIQNQLFVIGSHLATAEKGTKMALPELESNAINQLEQWCGPCRKENPNVVKTYNKYKDDGFTIVSVSLDTDKQKWLGAIQADGLIWPNHVSDLGGWNSKVSKKYNVSSIPFTVLLDKEGNIVQTNLRGPALENKLAEIFGH